MPAVSDVTVVVMGYEGNPGVALRPLCPVAPSEGKAGGWLKPFLFWFSRPTPTLHPVLITLPYPLQQT